MMKRYYLFVINSSIAIGLIVIVTLSLYTLYMVSLINQNILNGTRLISNQREVRLSLNDILYFPNLGLSIEKWKTTFHSFETNYTLFIQSSIVKKNISEYPSLKSKYEIAQIQWNKIHDKNQFNSILLSNLIEMGKVDKVNGLYFQFLDKKDPEITSLVEAFISERSFLQFSFESIFVSFIESLAVQSEQTKRNFINLFIIIAVAVAVVIVLAAVYHITTLSTLNTQLQSQNIKLRDKEEEYRTIFENVNAGIVRFHINPETIINCNPAFLTIFNIQSVRDIKNMPLERFFSDTNDKVNFVQHIQIHGSCKDFEYAMKKTDGSQIICSITATVEYTESREIRWVDAMIDDITKRKKQEEELELHRYHLEKMVKDRTVELHESNKKLLEKQDQIQRELYVAQRLQFSMVPDHNQLKSFSGLDIASIYEPLEDVGGDMFDIIPLNQKEIAFLIADVSGHGVASALIMTMIKFAFSSTAAPGKNAAQVCKKINEQMVKLIGDMEHYFTAIYGVIDLENKTLRFSNAGHQYLYSYKASGPEISSHHMGGMLMGVTLNDSYREEKLEFTAGDGILIYTDGITETRNSSNEFYTEERMKEMLHLHGGKTADEFVSILKKDLEQFNNNSLKFDDRTLVYIKFR